MELQYTNLCYLSTLLKTEIFTDLVQGPGNPKDLRTYPAEETKECLDLPTTKGVLTPIKGSSYLQWTKA